MIASWEVLTLVVLALLIFGPERLPQMARTLGRTVTKLRREANLTLDEIKRASAYDELRESANVSELRELATELKSEAADIQAQADGLSKAAVDGSPSATAAPAAAPDEEAPPPFDPDAT